MEENNERTWLAFCLIVHFVCQILDFEIIIELCKLEFKIPILGIYHVGIFE